MSPLANDLWSLRGSNPRLHLERVRPSPLGEGIIADRCTRPRVSNDPAGRKGDCYLGGALAAELLIGQESNLRTAVSKTAAYTGVGLRPMRLPPRGSDSHFVVQSHAAYRLAERGMGDRCRPPETRTQDLRFIRAAL